MNIKSITFLFGCLVTASITMQANAQQPVEHEFIRGDMPPGVAARFYQMSDPTLRGHMQPVQLIAPANTTIEVGDAASDFGQAQANQMTINMGVGYVYRFKLSNLPLPDAAGKTLYPSIEVIGKLSPPPGLEKDFPIQAVVTRDDIDIALTGRMVTRVIYLEDPRGTLPHLHNVTDQPSYDVRRGQDPLRAAEQMGRPMAILRMGSRVPMAGEVADWFTFGVAAPAVLPDPRAVNSLGLSERELKIVDQMRQAEANAEANANAENNTNAEAKADPNAESKTASKQESFKGIRRTDFTPDDSDQATPSIGTIAQTPNEPEEVIQSVVATSPIVPEPPKTKKPTWVPVKANATPKVKSNQPIIKSMTRTRSIATPAKRAKAKPPAPSLLGMGSLQEPEAAYPILRLPNAL